MYVMHKETSRTKYCLDKEYMIITNNFIFSILNYTYENIL